MNITTKRTHNLTHAHNTNLIVNLTLTSENTRTSNNHIHIKDTRKFASTVARAFKLGITIAIRQSIIVYTCTPVLYGY